MHPEPVVLDVSSWEQLGQEWDGRSKHVWLLEPDSARPWLWKPAQGKRLERQEHRAELAVSRLAAALHIPCADILLAERAGVPGCLSRDVKERTVTLEPGEWLLNAIDPEFNARLREPELHSVPTLQTVLTKLRPPPTWIGPTGFTAFEVMAGYLCLDALVLNRDRHAANWAVLRPKHGRGAAQLSPLYDNASALGLALSPDNMRRKLDSRGVRAYAEREDWARSFAPRAGRTESLVTLAASAVRACSAVSSEYWVQLMRGVTRPMVLAAMGTGGLSGLSRTFAVELVLVQRERILEAVLDE